MDAHLYAFKRYIHFLFNFIPCSFVLTHSFLYPETNFSCRSALQEVLDQKSAFHSLKHDVLPYLVRSQLVSLVVNGFSRDRLGIVIPLRILTLFKFSK